jgi:hypothetical protein
VALTNALAVLPAHAEAGKIFDFNLTLPIMVGQFLLLMVFLDKFWFGPVGKVLDERDALIRNQLGSVKVRQAPISDSSRLLIEISKPSVPNANPAFSNCPSFVSFSLCACIILQRALSANMKLSSDSLGGPSSLNHKLWKENGLAPLR